MAALCVITGATHGIGEATAHALAGSDTRLVLVARDAARAAAVADRIRARQPAAVIDVELADLSSMNAVRRLASRLAGRYQRIDVLINNAGVYPFKRRVTEDGFELSLAVNHLAPFLLTNLLWDRLIASSPSRVINVNSSAHEAVSIDLDDLQMERDFDSSRAYGRTKLANMLFTVEAARRVAADKMTVNAMHPGLVATNFANVGGIVSVAWTIMKPFLRTPAQGADTVVYLATSPAVSGRSGGYFIDRQPAATNPRVADRALAARLWDLSAALTGAPARG